MTDSSSNQHRYAVLGAVIAVGLVVFLGFILFT